MRGAGAQDPMAMTTYETYKALPSPQAPYTEYDLQMVAEIIRTAEASAARARQKATGRRAGTA